MIAGLALLLLLPAARAHGGEDHAAPAAVLTVAGGARAAASSDALDAVVELPGGTATLWLADHRTSAPVSDATATATLSGPTPLELSFADGHSPGRLVSDAATPAAGDYAGALIVTRATGADLLAVTGLHVGAPEAPGAAESPPRAALGAAALLLVALGYILGRARGAGTAAVLLLGLAARRGSAHGGEDHAAEAAAPTGGDLALPMATQFRVGLRTAVLAREPFVTGTPAVARLVARPGAGATLRAPVAGVLRAPEGGFPEPGAVVHAGQLLARIDEQSNGADRAAVADVRRQSADALAEARRAVALAEQDAALLNDPAAGWSERERLERARAVDVARAALVAAEAAAADLTRGVEVRAPVSGRIGVTLARPGDGVTEGDALFRVVDSQGLWAEAQVPERLAGLVTPGAAATVIPAAGGPLSAVVLDAGAEVDPATGTFPVTLSFDGGAALRPGMSATAWLPTAASREALVAPGAAVLSHAGESFAFVKLGPERFALRPLTLGGRSGTGWEVLDGLAPGERVVVAGAPTLRALAGR